MSTNVGTLVIEMAANLVRLQQDMNGASKIVNKTMRSIERDINLVKNAFGVLGVGLSGAAVTSFLKASIDLQDSLVDLSAKTGIAVEELPGLKHALDQSSTSVEKFSTANKALANNMASNSAMFAKLGITARDSQGVLLQLADMFASLPDGITKTAVANKLMGKSGEEMIPFLNQGSAAIREMIARGKEIYGVNGENAKQAKEFNDQLNQLKDRSTGLGISITSNLLPGLNNIATAMNLAAKEGGLLKSMIVGIGGVITSILDPGSMRSRTQQIAAELDALRQRQSKLLSFDKYTMSINPSYRREMEENNAKMLALQKELQTIDDLALAEKKRSADAQVEAAKRAKEIEDQMFREAEAEKRREQAREKAKLFQHSAAIVSGLAVDYRADFMSKSRALNAPLMSEADRQHADNLAAVEQRAARAREELGKLGLTEAERAARLTEVAALEQEQIGMMEALRVQVERNNASWEYGANVALRAYLDEASNVARQTERLFGNSFKGMEDGLVQFVQHGKMDFASLRDSIISDLIRIQMQKMLTGIFGSLTIGFGGYGDVAGVAAGVPSFSGGGFTGSGPRSGGMDGMGGFPAMLHPNETVVDHTRGSRSQGAAVINHTTVINIDARTDQAQVERLVSGAVQRGNADLVDKLQRSGAI